MPITWNNVVMKVLVCFLLQFWYVSSSIRRSQLVNKLVKIKPVGPPLARNFVPLTEIPPPKKLHFHADGRRHLDEDCSPRTTNQKDVVEMGKVDIWGEYYDDHMAKSVATVIIPDHIDIKHFEVTTPTAYLTVGNIEAIGFHPSTAKSDHPPECEKIYQDHMAELYSDEPADYSDESLEMARMPVFPEGMAHMDDHEQIDKFYSDEMGR